MYSKATSAFTLIELSIVLVIIGLITGSILAGQSMIENSKFRALAEERAAMVASTKLFEDKYRSLPGDFPRATSIWGLIPGVVCAGTSYPFSGYADGTCNGNGDGKVGEWQDALFYWHHLGYADLITLPYKADKAAATVSKARSPGLSMPQSQWSEGSGWWVMYVGNKTADPNFYNGSYGHIFMLVGISNRISWASVMSPNQLYILDKKFDDNAPNTGMIRSAVATYGGGAGCITGTAYVASDTVGCIPIWLTGY